MAETLSEFVEIPPASWAVLAVLLTVMIEAYKHLYWKTRLGLLVFVE
jgi:hypothetical protein